MTKIQTRLNEQRFFATSGAEMLDKYAVDKVVRTWNEDFVDQETGDVVSIERKEILFTRGTKFTAQNIDSVEFYLQSGELSGIEVSDQCRVGRPTERFSLAPYKVKARIGDKNFLYICQALSLAMAQDIVEDYIELHSEKDFRIISVAEAKYGVILNVAAELKKKDDEPIDLELDADTQNALSGTENSASDTENAASGTEMPEISTEDSEDDALHLTGDEEATEAPAEESADDTKTPVFGYYEITIALEVVTYKTDEKTGERKESWRTSDVSSFLINAANADEAKDVALAYCQQTRQDNTEIESAVTMSASPLNCTKVIEREFTMQYVEQTNNVAQ